VKLEFPWYYHFTVEAEAHFVDAVVARRTREDVAQPLRELCRRHGVTTRP
jgi:hypothetical protein